MKLVANLAATFSSFFAEGSYLTSFLLVTFLTFLIYLVYDELAAKNEAHPPLPRPLRFPIFGNLPQFIFGSGHPHETLTKFGKTFGDVFSVRLGSWDVLVINSQSAAREALFQKSAHFSSRPPFFTLRLCNSNEFTVAFGDYNPAQVQRKKALLQAFHRVILTNPEHLNKMVAEEAKRMNQILQDTGGSPFDPRACLKMVISRMLYRLTFGGNVNHEEENDLYHLSKTGREFMESSTFVLLADFMPWMKFAMKKQMQQLEEIVRVQLHGFVYKAYRRRKAQNILERENYCTAKNIEDFIKSQKRQEKLSGKNPHKNSSEKLSEKTLNGKQDMSEERATKENGRETLNMDGRIENDLKEEKQGRKMSSLPKEEVTKSNVMRKVARIEEKVRKETLKGEDSGMNKLNAEGKDGRIKDEIKYTEDNKGKEFTAEEEEDIEMRVVQMLSSDAFGAGIENTSSLLSWSVAYIAGYKELQRDLHAEIDQVIGQDNEPSIQHKQKMPLMQATILESLRLSSVIPMGIPHYCTKDSVVKGYHVAKGTIVLTNIWGINHDDRHFSHPECFEPYRFLDLKGELRGDRCSLVIPFNTGPRTCPGNAVTKTMMFLLLTSLLQKFELRTAKNLIDLRALPGPVLEPDFFEVVFHPREIKLSE